jgi:Dyp-type peroxidase family
MPTFSLSQTGIDYKDTSTAEVLNNMQAHIIKHHGRTYAYHLFLKFNKDKDIELKKWIAEHVAPLVTSGLQQLKDAERYRESDKKIKAEKPVITFSLSASGYRNLGLFDKMPENQAFSMGMKERKDFLKDFDVWEPEFEEDIDALIIVADEEESKIKLAIKEICREEGEMFKVVYTQRGKILKNEFGIGLEHFGYADGISQPKYLADDIAKEGKRDQWSDIENLDILLVKDPGIRDSACFGSYLVFRKLEQNVKGFKEAEEAIGQGLKDASGKVNAELAGGYIVGRFEDGTEVVNHDDEIPIKHPKQLNNDFDYRDDMRGLKCPYHAHIRLTNPRSDIGNKLAHDTRITRRGIPYDDIGRNDNLDFHPEKGVGLLFLCYQNDINKQFEVIQEHWANRGDLGHFDSVGQDGIIGQGRNNKSKSVPAIWGQNGPVCPINFGDFVKMKGGEYFFTPSIGFLSSINKKSDPSNTFLKIKKVNKPIKSY